MARWNEGYVADVVYTTNFFREMTPAWLAFAAVSLGHRPPDLSRPFRWAELGCGNGFTATVIAAACPQAEIWGFDFNPAHVETARRLAVQAGLSNISFVESSFAALADAPAAALPEFDFVVAHGVYSWIAPAHRRQIAVFVERRLRPGGLFYNSYNDAVGWGAAIPLRGLMRLVADGVPGPPDQAVPQIIGLIDKLREGGAGYFGLHPTVESRIETMRRLDPRYVAHEYLNEHWHPLMFAEVLEEMGEAKCGFIGSATLTDNIDAASVPPGLLPMFRDIRDPRLKETVRDFACVQGFRRDIYRKGTTGLSTGEHLALLEDTTLIGLSAPPQDGADVSFSCAVGTVSGSKEVYGPLLEALAVGPLGFAQARAASALVDKPLSEVLQAFALLTSGGFAHPAMPGGAATAGIAACRDLNLAVARMNADGASIRNMASPMIGSAIPVDLTETLILGELLQGRPAERRRLADRLVAILGRTGRRVQRNSRPVADPDEARQLMLEGVDLVLGHRAGRHRSLAILDAGSRDVHSDV